MKYIKEFLLFFKKKVLLTSFSLLICFINLVCLFTCCTFFSLSDAKTSLDFVYENDVKQVFLKQENTYCPLWGKHRGIQSDFYQFSNEQINILKENTKQDELTYCYSSLSILYYGEKTSIFNYEKNLNFDYDIELDKYYLNDMYNYYLHRAYYGIIEIDENNSYIDFKLDKRIVNKDKCHLPTDYNQIAISSFKADMYLKYGIKDDNGNVRHFNSIDELINITLDGYLLTGIYEFENEMDSLNRLINNDKIDKKYFNNALYSNCLFMKKGIIDKIAQEKSLLVNEGYYRICYNLPVNKNEAEKLFNRLSNASFDNKITNYNGFAYYSYSVDIDFCLSNYVDRLISLYSMNLIYFVMGFIVTLIINCILLIKCINEYRKENDLLSDISDKKQQIIHCFNTFIIIFLISLILASVTCLIMFSLLNMMFMFNIIKFSITSLIISFITLLVMMFILYIKIVKIANFDRKTS